jgi:hypothetical protein
VPTGNDRRQRRAAEPHLFEHLQAKEPDGLIIPG